MNNNMKILFPQKKNENVILLPFTIKCE